ncbi:MAG: hypothetical protein LBQ80_04270 [Clostridium sp.]|jgi:hypothetical protein|nr:hypothetical protein [Clostridium sp.]
MLKKWHILLLLVLFVCTFFACEHIPTTPNNVLPKSEISTMNTIFSKKEAFALILRRSGEANWGSIYYCEKDLDNDGVTELITSNGYQQVFYAFANNQIIKLGAYEFIDQNPFFSNNKKYPGIFLFNVGGGLERYRYLSLSNNKISVEYLWDEDFSGYFVEHKERTQRIIEYTKNKDLIAESKNAVANENILNFLIYNIYRMDD